MMHLTFSKGQSIKTILGNVKQGDCVYLRSTAGNQLYLEELALAVWKMGALPFFHSTSFWYENQLVNDESIPVEVLSTIPKPYEKLIRTSDACIFIEPLEDSLASNFNDERLEAVRKGRDKISDLADLRTFITVNAKRKKDPQYIATPDVPVYKLNSVAKNLLKSLGPEKGEFIAIRGGVHNQRLLEEVSSEALRKGCPNIIEASTDAYKLAVLGDPHVSCQTLALKQNHVTALMRSIDARIIISEINDPHSREGLDTALAQKRTAHLLKGRSSWQPHVRRKKYVLAEYPTPKKAEAYSVEYAFLEDMILGGIMGLDAAKFVVQALSPYFKDVKKLHMSDTRGTKFWVSVEGRKPWLETGIVSKEFHYINLPAGEIVYPVVETEGEGVINAPHVEDWITKRIFPDVKLSFRKGKLLLDKIEANTREEEESIRSSFLDCQEQDIAKGYEPLRTTNVCECGMGCNPVIGQGFQGALPNLIEEKVFGTAKIAFGTNAFFGGQSMSVLHVDIVTEKNATLVLEYMDGTKVTVLKEGEYAVNV